LASHATESTGKKRKKKKEGGKEGGGRKRRRRRRKKVNLQAKMIDPGYQRRNVIPKGEYGCYNRSKNGNVWNLGHSILWALLVPPCPTVKMNEKIQQPKKA
jgi:hypothetical protein